MAAKKPVANVSTGKAKKLAEPSKTYKPPVKGSGKPKYQNVIKEARLNTKKKSVTSTTKVKEKILGKKVTQQEKRAMGNRVENVPKIIDREAKELKGQRTAKSSTLKIPVKPRSGMGSRGNRGGGLGGVLGMRIR
jgi:hypothetical protein